MTNKQKKKFFKKLNRDYMKKIKKNIKPGKTKLVIDLKSNIVKRFKKMQKLP